jgi:hypothetical protein
MVSISPELWCWCIQVALYIRAFSARTLLSFGRRNALAIQLSPQQA